MKKRGTPIFKDNLTPQQRERQQAVFAKERRQEEKNRKTGEILSLLDVLGNDSGRLDAVSNNIKEQMRAQMAADSQISYFLDSDMPDFDFKGLTGQENKIGRAHV